MRTLKTGALYFALVFAAGWVFGPIRELWVVPYFRRTAGLLFEVSLMLVVMIVAARWTIRLSAPMTKAPSPARASARSRLGSTSGMALIGRTALEVAWDTEALDLVACRHFDAPAR